MKIIDDSLVEYISGGRGGNTGDYHSNRNRSSRAAPDICVNKVGVNGIFGTMGGIFGGPHGVVSGVALAGVTTAVSCSRNSSSGGRN